MTDVEDKVVEAAPAEGAPVADANGADDKKKSTLPPLPEVVAKPDSSEFDAHRETIDNAVNDMNDEMKVFSERIALAELEKTSVRAASGEKNKIRDQLSKEINALKTKKDAHNVELNGMNTKEVKTKIEEARKTAGKFESVEQVDRKIRELEHSMAVAHDLKKEKEMIAEINKLTKVTRNAVRVHVELRDSHKNFMEKTKHSRTGRDEVNAQLGALIENDKKLRESRKTIDAKYKDAEKIIAECKKGKSELYEKIKAKKGERIDVNKAEEVKNKDYDKYMRAMERYKRATQAERRKAEDLAYEKERAERAAAKQAELDAMIPWEEDVNTCDFLVDCLNKMSGFQEEVKVVEEEKKDLGAGAIMKSTRDADRDEVCFFVGKAKKSKHKNKATQKVAPFRIGQEVLAFFSYLKLGDSIPTKVEDVPKAKAAIEAKKAYYSSEEGMKAWKAKMAGKAQKERAERPGMISVNLNVTGENSLKVSLRIN